MDSRVERFFRSLKGRKIAFLGIGVSNTDTIRLFARQGLDVAACDRRTREELGEVAGELEAQGVRLVLGEHYLEGLEADVVFRTPGMYFHMPRLADLRRHGIVVTSEMEVFFDLCPCTTIAVTGSEGKTTTTTVVSELLLAEGKTVHLGGNIGRALLPLIFDIRPEDYAVVELSSFQLISMRPAPDISAVTNLTPDHLDVHAGMEEYVDAKRNIYLHQNAFSRTVLNLDNEITRSFATGVRGECMHFSLERPVSHGAFLRDGVLYRSFHGREEAVLEARDIQIPGLHNVANYLAALCITAGHAGPEAAQRVAKEFGGVEHRLELVREKDGVRWYNDSIATAPTGVIAGLHAFQQKLILIGGGYDKKIPFDPLAPEFIDHVKLLILTGDTADKMEQAVVSHPDYRGEPAILRAADMAEAVALAHSHATPGDIVSLSPACASFDRYPNFAARGRHFKDLVHAL